MKIKTLNEYQNEAVKLSISLDKFIKNYPDVEIIDKIMGNNKMKNIEYFKEQLEKSTPVTKEMLDKFERKSYYQGKQIMVGDIILYAFLIMGDGKYLRTDKINEDETVNLQLITLHQDELGETYEVHEMLTADNTFPTVSIPNTI